MDNKDYILLVDDEKDILEFIGYNLKKEGFQLFASRNGKEAVKTALEIRPHLILLDVMMPDMDGIETCEELRKYPELARTIIAFLTARGEDYSQIAGFEAGGDDYITKPIKPKVLISRIKALLKRYSNNPVNDLPQPGKSSIGLQIDKERFVVVNNGQELFLPKKEFELLALFPSPGKFLPVKRFLLKFGGITSWWAIARLMSTSENCGKR